MSAEEIRRAAAERIEEAEDVRDELCAALHGAGVVLPSLRVEPAAYADERPRPLVELGRCNLRTARLIAEALRRGGAGA
ncbi:hypothetical protein GCM10018793_47940 [Streptomyces sulfonofaciens]|uniref:Uncharacterized protein n=1 Tax=Streptomyces sulfonofaciens TaxID=68272 RepID=A0A919GHR6_9ACTN|nr:hypothetical protein [Streptomyces sulfonofaciens]GHH84195.1 hypothetical protein GCM10018793_47940 [Streptomyces sulfonofaciens]